MMNCHEYYTGGLRRNFSMDYNTSIQYELKNTCLDEVVMEFEGAHYILVNTLYHQVAQYTLIDFM